VKTGVGILAMTASCHCQCLTEALPAGKIQREKDSWEKYSWEKYSWEKYSWEKYSFDFSSIGAMMNRMKKP